MHFRHKGPIISSIFFQIEDTNFFWVSGLQNCKTGSTDWWCTWERLRGLKIPCTPIEKKKSSTFPPMNEFHFKNQHNCLPFPQMMKNGKFKNTISLQTKFWEISPTFSQILSKFLPHCQKCEFCQTLLKILSNFTQNLVKFYSKSCQILLKILSNFTQSLVKFYSKSCQILLKVLSNFTQNLIKFYSKSCQILLKISFDFFQNFIWFLSKFCLKALKILFDFTQNRIKFQSKFLLILGEVFTNFTYK